MKVITKKQQELYDFILEFWIENAHAPSHQDIKEEFKLKSDNSINKQLQSVTKKGYLINLNKRGYIPTVMMTHIKSFNH